MTLPLVCTPVLKPGCVVQIHDPESILVENGLRGLIVTASGIDPAQIKKSLEEKPASLPTELLTQFIIGGVVVEADISRHSLISAEYVAYRLLDRYKEEASSIWNGSPLLERLAQPGCRHLAIGFLLETYFHIRAANWTSAPVLSRTMSSRQRELLEQFFVDERGHGEHIFECFADVGLAPKDVKRGLPAPETELFERFMYSCASRSTAEFATALIIPEIPELPHDDTGERGDFVALLEDLHGIPTSVCSKFRAHEHDNTTLGHESLPIQLLAEEGSLKLDRVHELFTTLRMAIAAYRVMLDGIAKRYEHVTADDMLLQLPEGQSF